MGKEYTARSFKSGNSVAIRVPAGLGVEPGRDWLIARDDNGDLVVRPKLAGKRKFPIDKVWGIGRDLDLQEIKPEDRLFEERELIWPDDAPIDAGNEADRQSRKDVPG